MKTEYQVRPVTRYIVTRCQVDEASGASTASSAVGEYPNGEMADTVADAMVANDRQRGIDSSRSRYGLSLGEVISGQRMEPGE
ncbi:hypothetical protein [Pseudomonas sp. CCOS 191]|uniref:hypothetical protein n=1 Tax=Pseudomonas sp. CCOS 191 TaxID=1649877 RepID=UPI0006247CD0|nr:hypothetical protein [Pseudomonas sp. CCOS 191]CRI56391.1 hypothetical protein CCOS191_1855 [Pseudomonas sp. CCOS 191]